jgi:ATP-dependent Lhr-like helicase
VLTREVVMSEAIAGGFGVVYPVLKAMEEAGRLRRGYFIAGLGATQFALPGALDLLRSLKDAPEGSEVVAIAATDPANPYGAALKFPASAASAGRGPTRSVGATVVLVDGALVAYLARGDRQLLTWLPEAEPQRRQAARAVSQTLIDRARSGGDAPRGMLIEEIDSAPASIHPLAPFLTDAGFLVSAMGLQATFVRGRGSRIAGQSAERGEPESPQHT